MLVSVELYGYNLKQHFIVLDTIMNGINRLDIKQLRVLNALLDLKSLSQVARKMGLTQQAISEQLRKLRDLFDDRLFIRQGNSMVPTPKALSMQQPISHILKQKNRTGTFLCKFFAKSIVSTTVVIYSLTGVDMYDPGKKKAY